jgi:hypothetical protein
MVTRTTGQNIITTLTVTRRQDRGNRWEIYYRLTKEQAEPRQLIETLPERVTFIQNVPAQFDDSDPPVEIQPAEPNYSLFNELIDSYEALVANAEQKAVEHAEETGVFTEYVDNTDDLLVEEGVSEGEVIKEWVVGEQVAVGFKRSFEGSNYVCRQKHTTQADWTPDVTPALWLALPETGGGGLPLWQAGIYQFGDEVEHEGENWRNRRANNTQGFAPGTQGSGWMQISNTPAPWYNLGSEGYPINWEVTFNGNTWTSDIDDNFWEPGVFGWTQL